MDFRCLAPFPFRLKSLILIGRMFVLTGSDNLLNKTLLYDYAESIAGGCEPGQVGLIVRRSYQSDPEFVFGFYRYLKPEFLKRVCFKYVNHISDLVALLYLHSTQTQCSGLGFLFIENLEDFFDGKWRLIQGPSLKKPRPNWSCCSICCISCRRSFQLILTFSSVGWAQPSLTRRAATTS